MRRWLLRFIFVALLGFIARKLMESEDEGRQKVGRTLGRFVGAKA
jgi:hypothetical protein